MKPSLSLGISVFDLVFVSAVMRESSIKINRVCSVRVFSEGEMLAILLFIVNIASAEIPWFKDNTTVYEATDGEPFKIEVYP